MKLKELRTKNDLTQTELAQKLDLTKGQILRFENEESNIPIQTLIQIADYFDVSLDYLCDRQWNNQIGYVPEDKKSIINTILSLPDNDIKELESYVNGYLAGKNSKTNNFKIF